jgi:hypothetical protein
MVFKQGETPVKSCEHSGHSSTGHTDENVLEVLKIVNKVQQSTILEIAGRLGLSCGTCQQILLEGLNMWQISIKFLPWLLTRKQKQWHVFVCQELLDEVRNDQSFHSRVIRGDETWLYCYNPEAKHQSS